MATNMSIVELTTAVKGLIDLYKKIRDEESKLGETFHYAGGKLDLILETLKSFPEQPTITLQAQLSTESSPLQSSTQTVQAQLTAEIPPTAEDVLKAFQESANLLKALFEKVSAQETSTGIVQSYRDFLRDNGNSSDKLMEKLVLKLMENVCLLARHYGIEEGRLQVLRIAINELRTRCSSDPSVDIPATHSYLNSGSGNQFNSSTRSTQNNSTGSGTNLNGPNFHASVTFGRN